MNLRERYSKLSHPTLSERRLELAVLAVLALLLLILAYQALKLLAPGSADALSPAADSMRAASVAEHASASEAGRQQIVTRPLFWVERRPTGAALAQQGGSDAGPATVTAQGRPEKIKDMTLVGLFGGGSSGGAIVLRDGKQYRLVVGDELNGWTLDAINSRRVEFTAEGRRAELALPAPSQSQPQARPEPAAAVETQAPAAAQAPVAAESSPPADGNTALDGSYEKGAAQGHNSPQPPKGSADGLGFGKRTP